jgi:hypothetical protein
MSWTDELGQLLKQYEGASPNAPPASVHSDFSNVAQSAPPSSLASALGAAFRSPQTGSFGEMVAQLFNQSDPSQRAGILGHLLQAAGPGALSGGVLSGLGGLLGNQGGAVTPQQAQQVPGSAVQALADQAEKRDPSVVDRASQFYAQHPTLVKGLGAVALAVAMSHMSKNR